MFLILFILFKFLLVLFLHFIHFLMVVTEIMSSLIMVVRGFNPNSRIIQLVHMYCSCLTREAKNYVCCQIRTEFSTHSFYTSTSEEVIEWVNTCYPEAYPFVTGVIGFADPWVITISQVKRLILQRPYQYQGRRQFLDEFAEVHNN